MQDEGNADNPHAADQLAAHLRQRAEHVFDTGARCGNATVTLFLCIGDSLGGAALALYVDAPAGLFQLCFPLGCRVATISVDVATGVAGIEQRLEYRGIGHSGVRNGYFERLSTLACSLYPK